MNNKNKVYVVGHKNPDTDSICSAIAYAYLQNQLQNENQYIAMRAGNLNEETQFVLNEINKEAPEILSHVCTQVSDLDINKVNGISKTATLKEAWELMQKLELRTMPVVNAGILEGMLTFSDIAKIFMNASGEGALINNQNILVKEVMTVEGLVSFHIDDCLSEVTQVMTKKRHRDFPVINDRGQFVGLISGRRLLDTRKKQVILVDHNEKNQAVDGLEEAQLLGVIDHHKLSLDTMEPIFVRNQPVGCTCTIISQMYKEANINISIDIAFLLCSAILSDTLMFRSPTCTPIDKQIALELAEIAGIEVESYANAMFKAGSNLSSKTPKEICYQDFKKFSAGKVEFGVGQVSFMGAEAIKDIQYIIEEYMPTVAKDQNVSMVFFMLTDILTENTTLLCFGDSAKEEIIKAYKLEEDCKEVYLEGVVSRKKQFIPTIVQSLQG